MSKNKIATTVVVAILVTLGLVYAVSQNDDETASAKEVDGAFVSQMIPHHESAIEMAEVAKAKAQHPEISQLANNIIASQSSEVKLMNGIQDRLFGGSMDTNDHGDLGMDQSMMGMDMDLSALRNAKLFDREFIDQMIPHHQGAIRMARVDLQRGEDEATKRLATEIVGAQATEIEQMNRWRKEWYGARSPSGGVPRFDEPLPDPMEGMQH